jgi:hypothetical protein
MRAVRELWSDVVSWLMATLRIDLVMVPRERQRSMVEGLLPFLGWWVGTPGLLWRQKLLVSSQPTIVCAAREVRAACGRGPCHHVWCALRSPRRMQSVGRLMEGRMEARGSARPGEYRLKMVKVLWCCPWVQVMVVPRNESRDVNVVVAVSPWVRRT